ncbi:hypothetical protein ACFVRD_33245 [Streptomyces sp. NPDC057908]|uniref:hypothetical protein n=1 Tax=Streptomyces sp. NPDC057908 TaxID=3346276 RepID=UPI0036EE7DDF
MRAVEVEGAGITVDDGLEGAEPAVGRGGHAAEVDGEGFGFLLAHRFAARQQCAGLGGAGAGDPDDLQGLFEPWVGVGQV